MNVAIMGAGAIGCYFGALLARAGHSVVLIGRPVHVDAINKNGLLLETKTFRGYLPARAATEPSAVATADLVLFCVKSQDTESAGRAMASHLKPGAIVLNIQNGVDNAERLQEAIGRAVTPTVVYVGTEMAGPGHVRHHGPGELVIGAGPESDKLAGRDHRGRSPGAGRRERPGNSLAQADHQLCLQRVVGGLAIALRADGGSGRCKGRHAQRR